MGSRLIITGGAAPTARAIQRYAILYPLKGQAGVKPRSQTTGDVIKQLIYGSIDNPISDSGRDWGYTSEPSISSVLYRTRRYVKRHLFLE
jgi:hypothetical protein